MMYKTPRYSRIVEHSEILADCLKTAWCAETSADPEKWHTGNPSYGQCAVTALVVQDIFGGDLMRGLVGDVSHYWNKITPYFDLDYTVVQFQRHPYKWDTPRAASGSVVREREYVLSFPDTENRYYLLLERLDENLKFRRLTGKD